MLAKFQRYYFCLLWAMWFAFGLCVRGVHDIAHELFHAALVSFLLPGWIGVLALDDLRHIPSDSFETAPLAILIAALCWFFPVARVRRWFGTFDAFKEKKGGWPSLSRGGAAVLDILNRLRVGKGKQGGWA